MAKYKIEKNGGRSVLVVVGQKGQQLCEREFYAVNTDQIPCLVKAEMVRKSNIIKLLFDFSGFISLREYLFNPLNKQSFAQLLKNILNNLNILQRSYFNQQNLLLDINTVMVNPLTQELKFIYVPLAFYDNDFNLKEFLLSIINFCSFAAGEAGDYVPEYIRILNNGINFSVFDLEEYIKRLESDNVVIASEKKCSKCGSVLNNNVNFCPFCGVKVGEVSVNNGIYEPLSGIAPSAQPVSVAPVKKEPYSVDYAVDTPHPIPQAGPSDIYHNMYEKKQDYNNPETTVMPGFAPDRTVFAYATAGTGASIVNMMTGDRIPIKTTEFRIGKDQLSNNYCIRNNPAVSRAHAVIRNLNGRWFIKDLNSTNKTFVNGIEIYPGVDVELFSETKITFANEDFKFIL